LHAIEISKDLYLCVIEIGTTKNCAAQEAPVHNNRHHVAIRCVNTKCWGAVCM